jgi:chromosome segregation ATPase
MLSELLLDRQTIAECHQRCATKDDECKQLRREMTQVLGNGNEELRRALNEARANIDIIRAQAQCEVTRLRVAHADELSRLTREYENTAREASDARNKFEEARVDVNVLTEEGRLLNEELDKATTAYSQMADRALKAEADLRLALSTASNGVSDDLVSDDSHSLQRLTKLLRNKLLAPFGVMAPAAAEQSFDEIFEKVDALLSSFEPAHSSSATSLPTEYRSMLCVYNEQQEVLANLRRRFKSYVDQLHKERMSMSLLAHLRVRSRRQDEILDRMR